MPKCGEENAPKDINVNVTVASSEKKKKPFYKKWWLWVLVAIVFVSAISGGEDSPKKEISSTSNSSSSISSRSKDEKEIFKLGETAVFSGLKFTATEVKESYGEEFFSPEEGNVFIGVKFTIENTSNETKNISSLLLFDAYVDGIKSNISMSAEMAFDEGTLDGELASGKKMVGYYGLEVSEKWEEMELQVSQYWLSNSKAIFVFNK